MNNSKSSVFSNDSSSEEEEDEKKTTSEENMSSSEAFTSTEDDDPPSDNESSLNDEMNSEQSDNEAEELPSEKSSSSFTFSCMTSGCFAVLVEHPTTFKFSGMASFKVMSGNINILGYDIDASKDFVPVYSVSNICDLSIETTSCQAKNTRHCKEILSNLQTYADETTSEQILSTITNSHVLLLILPKYEITPLHFVGSYLKKAIAFSKMEGKTPLKNHACNILDDDDTTIKVTEIHNEVVKTIRQHSSAFVSGNGPPPRVMIYGSKSLGKSVSLRYFVNRLLSDGIPRVFVLDADPGQPEFTVSGCISLTEVHKPLLGPSYTHLQTPIKWKYTGVFSLDESPMYFKHLVEVINYFLENFSDEILLINTAGWVKSFGKEAIDTIRRYLSPSIEVELVRQEIYSNVMKNQNLLFTEEFSYPRRFIICSHIQRKTNILRAELRDIALLSYFGKLHPSYSETILTLNAFQPFCVNATDLAIHIINSHEDDARKLSILNGSVVALCSIDQSQIWDCEDNSQPKRLNPGTDYGECLGFGVVRATNFKEKKLFVITPVSIGQLQFVNVLVKGNVQLPDIVYKRQNVTGKDLPYVSVRPEKKGWAFDDKVKRRTFRNKN